MNMIISALAQGLIWSLLALGLFISFRVLNLADMSTEGTFTLGAATAVQGITLGMPPYLAVAMAVLAGAAAGGITGFLITRLNVPTLLAGILTMTGLYSINLRIMGKANLNLLGKETIFTPFENMEIPRNFDTILIGLFLVLVLIGLYTLFFKTEFGQALIATGDNEIMARSLGVRTNTMKTMGLMLSNGIIALSGSVIAQDNGYADVGMGIGAIVIGLASIIIGEALYGQVSLPIRLGLIAIGSIFYRLIMVLVLEAGLNPNDFKLISAVLLATFLAMPKLKELYFGRKYRSRQRSQKKRMNTGGLEKAAEGEVK